MDVWIGERNDSLESNIEPNWDKEASGPTTGISLHDPLDEEMTEQG